MSSNLQFWLVVVGWLVVPCLGIPLYVVRQSDAIQAAAKAEEQTGSTLCTGACGECQCNANS